MCSHHTGRGSGAHSSFVNDAARPEDKGHPLPTPRTTCPGQRKHGWLPPNGSALPCVVSLAVRHLWLGSLVTLNHFYPRLCVVWQAARAPAAAKFEKYYVTYANDDAARAGEAALVAGVDSWSDPVFVAGGEAMYKDPFKPPRGACKGRGWQAGRGVFGPRGVAGALAVVGLVAVRWGASASSRSTPACT